MGVPMSYTSQAYVDTLFEATRRTHETMPGQMVHILHKLSVPLSLDDLQN